MIVRVMLLGSLTVAQPFPAWTQPVPSPPFELPAVEVDPIRCWWRSSTGAVRTGATFSLDLTCAVLDNEAVQVVPDESRLGGNVIQMAPFEVVDSSHPADLRSGQRRFFQYQYSLRIINPDLIGKDVRIPDLAIHYRVNSRLAGNASLEGRDHLYLLPPQSIRVLSMVPTEAADIRDAAGEPFSGIESLMLRARFLEIVALTLVAVSGLMAVVALVRLARGVRRVTPVGERTMSGWRVARLVESELAAVERETGQLGWDEARIGRALAAVRVAAAVALGRRVNQRSGDGNLESGEGRLVVRGARRRKRTTWISSSVTTEDLARALTRSGPSDDPSRRQRLESLQTALAVFGRALYGQVPTIDRQDLDSALAGAAAAARKLGSEQIWQKANFLRTSAGAAEPQDQT
jgi:hypothetical protein